jgi:hypothetical protein
MNPHPDTIQQFRAGGFGVAVHQDCEIWCIAMAGLEVFWNRKAPIGGEPANCAMKAFKLCDSSWELMKQLSGGVEKNDKEKRVLIADYAQAEMQKARTELTSDGWVSTLPKDSKAPPADVENGKKEAGIALVKNSS